MLNLYLKLSITSFNNKFQQNNWHYKNHLPVLNQEILINPELSHALVDCFAHLSFPLAAINANTLNLDQTAGFIVFASMIKVVLSSIENMQ